MDAEVVGQLGMKRRHPDLTRPAQHRIIADASHHVDRGTDPLDSRRPDEHRVEGVVETIDREIGLERIDLSTVGIAPHVDVDGRKRTLVRASVEYGGGQQDHARAGAEHRQPVVEPLLDRLEQAVGLEQLGYGRRLAARHHQGIDRVELGRCTHLGCRASERCQRTNVPSEGTLQGQDADFHQPRSASLTSSLSISWPFIALPSPRDTLARMCGSRKLVVASTMALANSGGFSLLKMPDPTNTASAPNCITSDASAGDEMPPAQNIGTGSHPVSAISWTSGSGACKRLAHSNSSAESACVILRMSPM